MLIKRLFLLLTALPLIVACEEAHNSPVHYAIFYGEEATPEQLSKYDLLVFQPYNHTLLKHLTPAQEALMYVNLGESYPGILSPEEEARLAVDFNEVWENHIIDIRKAEWKELILNRFVAEASTKGFDGVMLDTVDSSLHLEATNPKKFNGMRAASIDLIRAIRTSYPNLKIMLNRGFDIWHEVGPEIQMVLIEDVFTSYDFANQQPRLQTPDITKQHIARIRLLKGQNPHLQFFCVEYWDMNDRRGVAKLYKTQREHGLTPYVATPPLDQLFEEPDASELMTTNGASNA